MTYTTAAQRLAGNEPRAAFVRLCSVAFVAYCSYAICRTPLLPLLARDLGADGPMIGFVMGASTLTGIVVKLPAGAWSDVLGRRPLLVLGAIVFAVMPFTYLGAASIGMLLAIRFLHGSATAIFGPVASASLSDLAPANRRATWLSTYATVQGTGQALGPVLAGYLIVSGRYDLAFIAAGLLGVATPVVAATWPSTAAPTHTARLRVVWTAIFDVRTQPLILATSVAQAAQFMLNGMLNAFLPLFARDLFGLSPPQLGWLFALHSNVHDPGHSAPDGNVVRSHGAPIADRGGAFGMHRRRDGGRRASRDGRLLLHFAEICDAASARPATTPITAAVAPGCRTAFV